MKAWFWLILVLGLIFRTYNFEKGFSFAHDQDLYSWIAKDIVVNKHNRLVGQITSVDGVFIGSAYYYLMAVFYKFGNMSPMAAILPITAIGLFTIWSFYFVVNKHFGYKAGMWASFIYSVSFGAALFDRWSVPTQPTVLWSIWFLFIILELLKGNLKVLPIYAFLGGFVWQLHIALLPILPLPILAYLISGHKFLSVFDKVNIKNTLFSVIVLMITLSPFLMFEIKHDFSQVKAMAVGISVDKGGPTGLQKFYKIMETSGREFQQRLLFNFDLSGVGQYWIVLLLMTGFLVLKSKISGKLVLLLGMWFGLILLAQFRSKRIVSEYYFTNLLSIYILILAVLLAQIKSKFVVAFVACLYFALNFWWLVTKIDDYESYFYKMKVVNLIKRDATENSYPCVAINFIADPGVGVGFRYLFWWQKINLVKPGTVGVPVYNIAIPWQISEIEKPVVFGRFGVIMPPTVEKVDSRVCNDINYQLDPLLGYVD